MFSLDNSNLKFLKFWIVLISSEIYFLFSHLLPTMMLSADCCVSQEAGLLWLAGIGHMTSNALEQTPPRFKMPWGFNYGFLKYLNTARNPTFRAERVKRQFLSGLGENLKLMEEKNFLHKKFLSYAVHLRLYKF